MTEKTLYDKTIARRLRSAGRRTSRTVAGVLALGLVVGSGAAAMMPAQAVVPATEYGGFNTFATATPLKLEFFEPAIPIPTEPQFELDFSYTRVIGDTGPVTTARSSALWPGPAVGEGLKTFGEQLSLPAALTGNGYPAQANAAYPGDETHQVQEYFPGMVGRVNAGDKRTVAKAGYSGSTISDGDAGDGETESSSPQDAISQGDLGALGGMLTGSVTDTGNANDPAEPTPLGPLSVLIDFDGMASVSSTDYDGDKVVATATSRIGELRLLAGLIKLTGINVVTKATSTVEGGKTSQVVDVGGMTIAGQKFSYGPEGFNMAGTKTPVPGLPTNAADLLEELGVSFEVPLPVTTKAGPSVSVEAAALRVTLDTKPLRKNLPLLPLDDLVLQLPDMGQGNVLKGMLLSLNTFAPKVVMSLGYASARATTVSMFDMGGGVPGASPAGATGVGGATGAGGAAAAAGGAAGEIPPAADVPAAGATTPVQTVASIPGLPPLGSIPMLLMLAGLALAGGVGWYLRQAGGILFGGVAACTHGLKAGIPDLRKV